MNLKYRPEIDGLRALAVVPVLLFHAGLPLFSGGYVGVDIFFVISGYLITSIILKEQSLGTFRISNFYMRRARRILPALWLVTILSIPFAWFWMLPADLDSFAGSVVSIPYFVSNVFFWSEIGYFNLDAELKPLLHTWSLAVEEQYYLLFPAFLIATARSGRKIQLLCLFIISLISLLLSEWGWRNAESANFYLAPTRVWEILVGAILAYGSFRPTVFRANLASVIGLTLIIFAIFSFESRTPTPSLFSLIPVLGTALVIYGAIEGTFIKCFLSWRPCVFTGLISYSLYLFHQPILAFWRIRTQEELSNLDTIYFLILSLLCAAISWKFIEGPFRKTTFFSNRIMLVLIGFFTISFSAFGVYVSHHDGVSDRLPASIHKLSQQGSWNERCLFQITDGNPSKMPIHSCHYNSEKNIAYAIWGDSIAAAIAPSVANQLMADDIGLFQFTHGHCAPIAKVERAYHRWSSNCQEFNQIALDFLLSNQVEMVMLAANWNAFIKSGKYYVDSELITDDGQAVKLLATELDSTIKRLNKNGIEVIVLYPVVQSSKNVIHYIQQSKVFDSAWPNVIEPRGTFLKNARVSYELLDSISQPVIRVYPEDVMCEQDICDLAPKEQLVLSDEIHPTDFGAAMIAKQIYSSIQQFKE